VSAWLSKFWQISLSIHLLIYRHDVITGCPMLRIQLTRRTVKIEKYSAIERKTLRWQVNIQIFCREWIYSHWPDRTGLTNPVKPIIFLWEWDQVIVTTWTAQAILQRHIEHFCSRVRPQSSRTVQNFHRQIIFQVSQRAYKCQIVEETVLGLL